MKRSMKHVAVVGLCSFLGSAFLALAETVELTTVKDNSMFVNKSTDDTSNGAGDSVFSGRTGLSGIMTIQRGLVAFDVAGNIPAGAQIRSACLTMYLVQTGPAGPQTHSLHRLLSDWGEGTSSTFPGLGAPPTTDDATWQHTFYPDAFWATPGGDFDPTITSSTTVGDPGAFYSWSSTPLMVATLQDWLDNPADNFGWMIRGNEVDLLTAKKLASKEYPVEDFRPVLTIHYAPPGVCIPDLTADGFLDAADLALVLGNWGSSCAQADLNGDGFVDAADLASVLGFWGPC